MCLSYSFYSLLFIFIAVRLLINTFFINHILFLLLWVNTFPYYIFTNYFIIFINQLLVILFTIQSINW